MPVAQQSEVAGVTTCVLLALVCVIVTGIADCYRPGSVRVKSDGKAVESTANRECCGIMFGRGLVIPTILVAVLGALIEGATVLTPLCESPMGYCATVSCVSANIVWQGYVFMFLTLTLTPTLVLIGIFRHAQKLLCCVRFYHCGCNQYATTPDRHVSDLNVGIVWVFMIGCVSVILTGMLPTVLESDFVTEEAAEFSSALHLLGVGCGTVLVVLSALLLSLARFLKSGSSCCSKLCKGDTTALAALGYALFPAFIIGSGIAFAAVYRHTMSLHVKWDICINNQNQDDCALGHNCTWNATGSRFGRGTCIDSNCNTWGAVSTAAEYLALTASFMLMINLMPAMLAIVGSDAPGNDDAAVGDENDKSEIELGIVTKNDEQDSVAVADQSGNNSAGDNEVNDEGGDSDVASAETKQA